MWQLRDDQLVSPEWGCKLRLLPTRNFLWGLAQGSKFRKVFSQFYDSRAKIRNGLSCTLKVQTAWV